VLSAAYLGKLTEISAALHEAQKPVRILRGLAWSDDVRQEFFARGARELPRPVHAAPGFDVAAAQAELRAVAARAGGDNDLERLIRETCESYVLAAEMLGAVGTRRFWELSCALYGRPESISCDNRTTNLALAQHFDRVIAQYPIMSLDSDEPELPAEGVAAELARRFDRFFVDHDIKVELVDQLAAKAVAGADTVKIRRGARFTSRDLQQLEHHEGYVHVATTLNGRDQPVLSFLGHGAPRTVRTQEGLAVLTEFVSQTMDLERVRRLTDRILAIKMAEEGASFLDLYRWFLTHDHDPPAAYDCAFRVCRGGLVEGGAPFTKDVVYLDGLLRVSNFLRATLVRGRADFVATLFAGKLDLGDIPILAQLAREGAVAAPRYLPAWARDLRFLTAYMSYSAFLNQTDLDATRAYYDDLIARAEQSFQ
jgi:uncharacterized protein (TIGR02421 family)